MKVVLVSRAIYPFSLGGMEKHTSMLANYLVEIGIKVDVIAPGGDKKEAFEFKFNHIPVSWPKIKPNLFAYYLFTRRASRIIQKGNYDVAYGQGAGLWAYLNLPRKKRVPTIMNPHGMEPSKTTGIESLLKTFHKLVGKYIARRSDRVISLGGKLTSHAINFYKIAPEKVVEIPNGIAFHEFEQKVTEAKEPSQEGLRLLFVGRLATNKGGDVLIKAFQRVEDKLPTGTRLLMAGSGPKKDSWSILAEGSSVELLGRVSDEELINLYANADVFVYPTLFEGMPTVVLEAMAAGLPLITTDIGALQTMVFEGKNGLVVPPGDVEALAREIERMVSQLSDSWQEFGRESQQLVKQSFTWPQVAKQTVALFKDLVKSQPE